MQTTIPIMPTLAIEVPKIDTDEAVTIFPVASVAPLEGAPDGERINIFALAPLDTGRAPARSGTDLMRELGNRMRTKPLTYLAVVFSIGFILARVLR